MIGYAGFIFRILFLLVIAIWIARDIQENNIEKKYYWIWIFIVAAMLPIGIIAMAPVVAVYFYWSRKLR